MTMEDAYERTKTREREIEAMGLRLVTIWGCELERELENNPEMKDFFVNLDLVDPLDARDGFYGGQFWSNFHIHIIKC